MEEEIRADEVIKTDAILPKESGANVEGKDKKGAVRRRLSIISLLILIAMALPVIFWGFSTIFIPSNSTDSLIYAYFRQENFDSLENDYEALKVVAGTYVDRRTFWAQNAEPITRLFSSTYIFNQDRTFETFQNERLIDAGNFIVLKVTFDDDAGQISRSSQQVIESFIGNSDIDLFQINMQSEEGISPGLRQTFFMFRTSDGYVIIYDPLDESITFVEQL